MEYTYERHMPPLPADLSESLKQFWQDTFHCDYAHVDPILQGQESPFNQDIFYLARHGATVVSTTHLTICRHNPRLAGLGEVATAEGHKGKGLAFHLCRQAAEEFDHAGGQAIFLGTVNPAAAKLYEKLGWQYLTGTRVMARIQGSTVPEQYLQDLFTAARQPIPDVRPMSPGSRIPIIPAVVFPHPWVVLDANTELFSSQFTVQTSCMGLFPRYQNLMHSDQGRTWVLVDMSRQLVLGICSIKTIDTGIAHLDGFTHPFFMSAFPHLIRSAVTWCEENAFRHVKASLLREDGDKTSCFRREGFEPTGHARDLRHNDISYTFFEMVKHLEPVV